jgi:phage tail P2-like protein
MQSVLAPSVAVDHIKVFEQAFAAQLEQVDLSVVLMDLVDTCPADALPFLAVQFNVEGYKGMRFCQSEQDKRNLIKRAIDLHRYKGTRWAVAESLKVLGYNDVEVDDQLPGIRRDGTYQRNGTVLRNAPHWAMFRVIIYISETFTWTANLYPDIVTLVNEYKNVRSHLLDISAGLRINEPVSVSEDDSWEITFIDSDNWGAVYRNGSVTRNGSYTRNQLGIVSDLSITIE